MAHPYSPLEHSPEYLQYVAKAYSTYSLYGSSFSLSSLWSALPFVIDLIILTMSELLAALTKLSTQCPQAHNPVANFGLSFNGISIEVQHNALTTCNAIDQQWTWSPTTSHTGFSCRFYWHRLGEHSWHLGYPERPCMENDFPGWTCWDRKRGFSWVWVGSRTQ